jgi:autotransporter-associated beta strand protein
LRSGVAGETNIYQGKVTLAANATINAGTGTALTLDVVSGDAVDLGVNTLTFLGSGAHAVNDAIIGTGGIIKTSSGTTTLSGMSSYTGATTISNGVLRAGAAAGGQAFGNLSAVTLASAPANQTALDLNNHNQTIGSLAGGGVGGNNLGVLLGSGTLTTGGNNANTTYNGQISGIGGLVKTGTGTQTLTASNSFTGAVAINAGVLELAGTTGGAAADAVSVSVATNAILLLSQSQQVNNSASVSLSGGTIQRGSGVSEVFGDLSITTGSFLDFGTGTAGNLTFGTYQNDTTPSALLTLDNFLPGNSFTFSSTSFSTNSVGSYFTFGTGYVGSSISSTGSTFTITAIPEPSTMVVAAALVGFFALSACRFRSPSRLSDSSSQAEMPPPAVGRLPEPPGSFIMN